MVTWNFADIRQKVRKVTGRLSLSELSNQELDKVINQFVEYEFPAEVKLDRNYSYYTFNTVANQQDYTLPETYTNFDPEATIDSRRLLFYPDPDAFNQQNPQNVQRVTPFSNPTNASIAGFSNAANGVISVSSTSGFSVSDTITVSGISETGGGTSLNGTFTISSIGSNTITVSTDTTAYAVYSSGGLVTLVSTAYSTVLTGLPIQPGSVIVDDVVEVFTDNGAGILTGSQGGSGSINYTTGALSVTFNTTPTGDATIQVSYIPYTVGTPTSVLMFNNKFTFFPVPDRTYRFKIKAWSISTVTTIGGVVSSTFVNSTDSPLKPQWAPAIAYGAARRIHSDYGEMDAYQEVTALYKEQIAYVLRRTHQDLLNTRAMPNF